MGPRLVKYAKDKTIQFMGDDSTKERLRKFYGEEGSIKIVQELLDQNPDLNTILEDNGLQWPDTDAKVTGSGGFFEQMDDNCAEAIVTYLETHQ